MKSVLSALLLFVSLVSYSAVDHWETVLYETNTWRYLSPTSPVSSTWINAGFNDASWSTGIGGIGYGDGDDNTVIAQTTSCYQRTTFNIVDVSAIEMLVFNIDYDDSYVAYLNGVEIGRDNITSVGQPNYNQLSDGQHEATMYQGGYPATVILDQNFITVNLVNGTNTLCIQVHNATTGSSDLSCRAFLTAGINDTSTNYGTPPEWFVAPLVFTDSNLPIVVINTENGATIPDEPSINGTMGIIYNGVGVRNYTTDPYNEYNGNIGIQVRGSSSQMFPKKQWSVETRDASNVRQDVTIFNMAFDNDWVLYAPYSDKSLIRNVLAYQMGWDLGSYAPRTQLCEVVLNGQYEGVYVFTEKIKRKDGKVGTDDVNSGDISGNELTGDYIVKVDKNTGGSSTAWTSPFAPYSGASQTIKFQLHDPSYDSLNATQRAYIENYITQFETALNGPNFTDPVAGYAPYIDTRSFVNFLLVNEASRNLDGYRISSFLHKIRASEGGKLFAGPLWDFNLAFGNANYCNGGSAVGWEINFDQVCGGDNWQNPFWWRRLTQDSEFTHTLNCTWQEMRNGPWHLDSIYARIDSLASYLNESSTRNFQRWPILGTYVWPNNFVGSSYAEEIDYVKTWVATRFAWLDANMYGSCPDLGLSELYTQFVTAFPNPTESKVQLQVNWPLQNGHVTLYDINGTTVYQSQWTGSATHEIDMNSFQSGLYIYQITGESGAFTGKLLKQ